MITIFSPLKVPRSARCLHLPTFSNLTSLELCVNYYTDQGMIAYLLNICPNLKCLLIREVEGYNEQYLVVSAA